MDGAHRMTIKPARTVPVVLERFGSDFSEFTDAFAEGQYVLWLGSGISRDRVPNVYELLERILEHLRTNIDDPDSDCAYRAALSAGRDAEALQFAQEGVDAFPRKAPLRNNLAVLTERAGQAEAAEQLLAAALEDDPTLPQLSKNLGDLYYKSGRAEDAQAAYQRAVKLAPGLGDDVYFKLGNLALKFTQRSEAVAYWREAIALNPANDTARRNLAAVDGGAGDAS